MDSLDNTKEERWTLGEFGLRLNWILHTLNQRRCTGLYLPSKPFVGQLDQSYLTIRCTPTEFLG